MNLEACRVKLIPRSRIKVLLLSDSFRCLGIYLTKLKQRPSSVPQFMIFVCKHAMPIFVATPTRLVAMVTNLD